MKNIMKKYRLWYIFIVILSIFSSVLLALFGIELGSVIDVVVKSSGDFNFKVINCILLISAWFMIGVLYAYVKSEYSFRIIKDLKSKLFISIFRNDMFEYVEKSSEYYLNTLTKKIDLINDNYISPYCNIVNNFISAIISIATIILINWKLGLSFIAISLITIVLSQLPSLIMVKKTSKFSKKSEEYLEIINNYLKGYEQIKLLNIINLLFENYKKTDKNFEKSRKEYVFTIEFTNNLGIFFSFLAQLICMSIGVYFVMKGELTVGLLISAINLLNSVFNPLQLFVQRLNLMKTVKNIREEIDEILKKDIQNGNKINFNINEINIKDLSFNFGDKKIFKNFSFNFEKGKKYAITGESGCGKTTLMKLLMKYYDKNKYLGDIQLNQKSIRELSNESLYDKIAFIQRNDFYINGTVKENISLYRDCKIEENLTKSLKFNKAFLDKNIKVLSINNISMGEKQRIDIARFLIKDYDVIIFDEPTSNLDSETSNMILDLIHKIENKIVIVITHIKDESALEKFDEVIRLWIRH